MTGSKDLLLLLAVVVELLNKKKIVSVLVGNVQKQTTKACKSAYVVLECKQ